MLFYVEKFQLAFQKPSSQPSNYFNFCSNFTYVKNAAHNNQRISKLFKLFFYSLLFMNYVVIIKYLLIYKDNTYFTSRVHLVYAFILRLPVRHSTRAIDNGICFLKNKYTDIAINIYTIYIQVHVIATCGNVSSADKFCMRKFCYCLLIYSLDTRFKRCTWNNNIFV